MKTLATTAALAALAGFAMSAVAQQPSQSVPSLQDLLKTHYKLARTAASQTGTIVIEAGSVFVVKKGGLLGVPPTAIPVCTSQFKDGALHAPGGFCVGMSGPTARYLDAGTKVYVTKLDVNQKKNSINLQLIECDSCNGVTAPSSFKTSLAFQFAPNYLDTAEPGQVTDVIDQVLEPESAAAAQPAPASAYAPAPAAPPAPAQPAQIQLGDSPAQVQAILGPPETQVPLGTKLIYVYRNLKVTFVDGKVTDVQ
jgi:hypothetical protein